MMQEDKLKEICNLCNIVLSTGSCNHILDLGDGRVGMKRTVWEELVNDRWALRKLLEEE